jgi:hypothetical protein
MPSAKSGSYEEALME